MRSVSKEEIMKVMVTRNKVQQTETYLIEQLEKWCGEPFFANDVAGLFVKVSYSANPTQRNYRLVEILGMHGKRQS